MAENFKTDFFTDRIGRGIQDIFQAQRTSTESVEVIMAR